MRMENQYISKKLNVIDLALIDYKEAWDLQRRALELRLKNEISDVLFLLEHPHTYTLGKTADQKNLIASDEELKSKGISVYDIDRGGDITYHGPGQIVGYPIINLAEWKKDTHLYLRALEEVIIQTCSEYGIQCGRNSDYTGVWIENRKICAIGIKVSRWITMHGFAFNVNADLALFNGIIPCGIREKEVTSLDIEIKDKKSIDDVKGRIINNFQKIFEYNDVEQNDISYILKTKVL